MRVWQRGTHPEAEVSQLPALQYSRRIRLLMMERMRISGVKVSVVKKGESLTSVTIFRSVLIGKTPEIMRIFEQDIDPSQPTRAVHGDVSNRATYPPYRRPTGKQIVNMMKQWRQRERLDRNPLFAVHIIAQSNRDRIYW